MKRLLYLLIPIAIACGGGEGAPPGATPPPVATKPCVEQGFRGVWAGECEPSPECMGPDEKGYYYGDCKTKK